MKTLFAMLAMMCGPALALAQSDNAFDVSRIAKDVEQRIRACPPREVIAEFKRGLHKSVWQKVGWGPPSDVLADAKPNDSILYPYILTVEFKLGVKYGPERKTKAEAETDTKLSPSSVLIQLGADTSKNRNIYLVKKDGIRLKAREVFPWNSPDTEPGHWTERPTWANACWDWVGSQ